MSDSVQLNQAREDFRQARRQAALQELMARFTGKSVELLAFEDVRRKLRASAMAERGLRDIPLAAIVGTVGRYTDFTRDFLPRAGTSENRWANVKLAATDLDSAGLPPIEVYQIGEAYFVRDGHHRVSVARQLGNEYIPAFVIEVQTRVALAADTQPDDLIRKAEYADFLEATHLDELRPEANLDVSVPGQYVKLQDHIEVHRFFVESALGRAIPEAEAVAGWYDQAYLPLVQIIRERGLLRDFPGRTETDLYLWVAENAAQLREELGLPVKPEAVAERLAALFSPQPGRWRERVLKLVLPQPLTDGPSPGVWRKDRLEARYLGHLFADLLVPLSGEPQSWLALDQALVVARREQARLIGLHVVATESAKSAPAAQALRAEFDQRCAAAGLEGRLAIDVGEVALRICERAALADLVVLNLSHPPSAQRLERLGSGFRTLIRRCPRPVLAVPRQAAPLERQLLAFDGSPKAKEALFIAAYLAAEWRAALTVLTVKENGASNAEALHFVREYLDFHEITAEFVEAAGTVPEALEQAAQTQASDLILMGGYGARPVVEVILGSSVDQVLRQTDRAVLLCR